MLGGYDNNMKGLFFCIAAIFASVAAQSVFAGGEEVVIVYNTRVKESREIAEYYAGKRNVPKSQIFGFSLTAAEEMLRPEFREELQKPLLKKLEANKLWRLGTLETKDTNGAPLRIEGRVVESKIRYLLLCYGVPLKILRDSSLREPDEAKIRIELRRNEAAVDSELILLPMFNQKLPYTGPLQNPLYTTTNAAAIHPTNGVLIVTRLDGPTPAIARGLVDKALQAEADGFWGRTYFDLRNTSDPNLKVGDDWIRGASEIARHLGFETIVDTNGGTFPAGFPMSQIAFYAGWYTEGVSGAFTAPKMEFMPGAFAYHLHSFSAASMRKTNNNWVAPLLVKGATASMGTVDEPYLAGTPDIAIFAGRFFFFRMTFGEAALASQNAASWQTTVVGDPLYRPFVKPPKELHDELEARGSPLVEWSYFRLADLNLANGSSVSEVVGLVESWPITKKSAVLSEKLADLYVAQGKPSAAITTYQEALKLNPSPQQRLRIRLTLGEKFASANQNDEAMANYQDLLKENPNYPDADVIRGKISALTQKSGK
jgi:uncharacterized protein (TIGR03790 family)